MQTIAKQSVAILGAGLLGRLLALLLKDEFTVSLYEKHSLNDSNSTGRLAAAMVAPTAESVVASEHIVAMGRQATALWPALLKQLELPSLYQNAGTLVLAHRQDLNDLKHFQQRLSLTGTEDLTSLTQNEILELEPELSNVFNYGLFIANEGQVDNKALYQQSETLLRNSNISLYEHQARECHQLTNDYNLVIDCRGLGSKNNLSDPEAKLRGVRGEVVRIRAPEVSLTRPIRIMHPRHPIYIAPKPNHEFVIGATEIESQDDKNPTVRSTLELLSAAYSVHKGFAEGEVLSIKAGLRPTLLDNEPRIVKNGNIIHANGLYRHGYLITPYVLQQLLLLIAPQLNFDLTNQQQDNTLIRELT